MVTNTDTIMVGHLEVVPTEAADNAVLAILRTQPALGRGSFASVFALSDSQVLKVTCCEATQKLYDAILRDAAVPAGIPRVFDCRGTVGHFLGDELAAKAYVVERLRAPCSEDEALFLEAIECFCSMCAPKFLSPEQAMPRAHADVFREAAAEFPEIGAAFTWLADFVEKAGCVAPDMQAGNLMYTSTGVPAVADPLQPLVYSADWKKELERLRAEEAAVA